MAAQSRCVCAPFDCALLLAASMVCVIAKYPAPIFSAVNNEGRIEHPAPDPRPIPRFGKCRVSRIHAASPSSSSSISGSTLAHAVF